MSTRELAPLGEGTQTMYYSNGWMAIRVVGEDGAWVASDTAAEVRQ